MTESIIELRGEKYNVNPQFSLNDLIPFIEYIYILNSSFDSANRLAESIKNNEQENKDAKVRALESLELQSRLTPAILSYVGRKILKLVPTLPSSMIDLTLDDPINLDEFERLRIYMGCLEILKERPDYKDIDIQVTGNINPIAVDDEIKALEEKLTVLKNKGN